ncbi:MAG: TIGR00282 family metallophosphoesterase [Bacillota bacterium]|nr:TIGR00282 family metallophosphoesterase [Bacillota bacterium]
MRLLFIGDIYGAPGRKMVIEHLPRLLAEKQIDFTIANGENCSGGFGINRRLLHELTDIGVDAFTMGNHTWDNKEIFSFIDSEPNIVRPANYPPGTPGRGWRLFEIKGRKLLLCNIIGRVFMPSFDCPFRSMDAIIRLEEAADAAIFVDFHAEATSEKVALGWYLDGRVAAMVGTHTHIQTNDARILPRGSGYITDAGMTGPRDSVLGVEREIIVQRFLTGVSPRFEAAAGDLQFNGIIFDIDERGKCAALEVINFWEPSL